MIAKGYIKPFQGKGFDFDEIHFKRFSAVIGLRRSISFLIGYVKKPILAPISHEFKVDINFFGRNLLDSNPAAQQGQRPFVFLRLIAER